MVDPRDQAAGKKKTFTGTGYRLGQSNNDSEGMVIFFFIVRFINV